MELSTSRVWQCHPCSQDRYTDARANLSEEERAAGCSRASRGSFSVTDFLISSRGHHIEYDTPNEEKSTFISVSELACLLYWPER